MNDLLTLFKKKLTIKASASPDNSPTIARPLGKMEHSAWIFDQASPFNIGAAVDIHGNVTEDALAQVLRWCQIRYPMLRSILRQEHQKLYFACYEPAAAPVIPIDMCSSTEESRDRIATEELRRPFDGYHELMVRVKLVKFSEDYCSVFVTFQHLIGDGFSHANLLVDIVNLLGTVSSGDSLPAPDPLPFPPMLEDGMASRFKGIKGLLQMVSCQSKVMGQINQLGDMPAPLRNDADVPFAERRPIVETFTFNATETASLIAYAKQEQVTLYALLIAITMDVIHPLLAESPKKKDTTERVITMPMPINLRPFLSIPKNDFGLFSSTVDVVRKLTDKKNIPEMAKDIRREIKSAMKRDSPRLFVMPTIAAIMDWKLFFPKGSKGVDRAARFIVSMAKYSSTSLTFLNLTRMSTKTGNFTVTNARGYVAPSILGTALFSAVLFEDLLNIHLSYNEKQFSGEDAALLKHRFKTTALAVAQGSNTMAQSKP
ncbi:uncharacterized protein containing a NRPS condensation (elongation) domain [Leptolyngbya sp. PCC 7375]|nr:uncharacterized protein containing a NRPS condensation (elongation) domain [Leptolyngbya sp. PCC 7375]DAC80107.1 TPA_exp: long-chain fatty acid CoA-ligase [Leptolyngbya sp. PCC 7375]